jgi:hypothetical protein
MWRWKLGLFFPLLFIFVQVTALQDQLGFTETQIDSLEKVFGTNKHFDSLLKVPALLAIQHYPELTGTHIEFRYRNIPTLMAARPTIDFLFRKKNKRKYILIISTNPKNHSRKFFHSMSLSAKTGILGHEYAHFLDYENKSNVGLLFFTLRYLLQRKKIERETDKVAIERGLGEEMLNYNLHIRKSKLLSKEYLRKKKKYYLSATEIEKMVGIEARRIVID